MKSLFKRTLATATGSVLALSQLVSVAANVNVSAADTLTVDKAFVLNVPIDPAAPLKAEQVSDWADLLESKFIELGDNHTFQYSTQGFKNRAKRFLEAHAAKYMSSEDMDALLAQIADKATAVVNTDGTYSLTLECGEFGDILGSIVQNLYSEGQVPIDWTQFHASGKAIVKGQFNFDDKTATYGLTIVDENGTEHAGDAAIQLYAEKKLAEAKELCLKNDPTNVAKVEKVDAELHNKIDYINQILSSMFDVSSVNNIEDEDLEVDEPVVFEGITDPEEAYMTFVASKMLQIYYCGIPKEVAGRVVEAFGKRVPESLADLLADERVTSYLEDAKNAVNNSKANVVVDLAVSDIADIINEGYDYNINIPNGYSFNGTFSIAEDQTDELLDAIKAVYTDEGFIAGADLETLAGYASDDAYQSYTVVDGEGAEVTDFTKDYNIIGVVSHKEISGGNQVEFFDLTQGTASYDVKRVIEQIVVEEVKDTTTTTTTTTESTTTTTETTSSTTETTSSTTESTTTTTESTTTTTETTTTTTETTSSTTDTTTTTTLATYVSFDVGANGNNELVYWSEESDATFDFDTITIKAHFIVAGEDQVEDVVDVTEFFGAEANSPAEMGISLHDGVGSGKFPVGLILKDEAGLAQVIDEKGYDSKSIIADQGFAEGAAVSRFHVILVLRGDGDLNGEISVEDAQYASSYYTFGLIKRGPAQAIKGGYYLNEFVEPLAVMPYSHYAMDTADGDGVISVEDTQRILQYYTHNTLLNKGLTWDQICEGVHVIPLNELHADPLAKDDLGKADYDEYMANR